MTNVVITGSTRGLGYCMAIDFLNAGCNVTISGHSEASFENLKILTEKYKGRVLFVPCDVRSEKEVETLWSKSYKQWGSVDIWINNAGIISPTEFVYQTPFNYVDEVIDTNVKGMIYGSQVAAKNMLEQGHGQIWNMEGYGSNNMIATKMILYGTTKHALTYFTKGLAKELAGSTVQAGRLWPSMMATDFVLKHRDGSASPSLKDPRFVKIFNILGDRPETVSSFFVPRILANKKNNKRIAWLTYRRIFIRFLLSPIRKRNIL
jgi:short-subunit dehydrogenase